MLCILYVNAVGLCLGLAGLLIERALPASAARRWVWCLVIPISIVLPGVYRTQHPWTVAVLGHDAVSHTAAGTFETAAMSAPDPGFWVRIESYNTAIGRFSLLASAFLLCWGVSNGLRLALAIAGSRRRSRSRGAPVLVDGVPVFVTDSIGPATIGFWRSRVIVPRWVLAMPRAQRQYVIRHEDEHRSARDARLLFFASLTLLLVPWNVALWWQLRRLYLAVEIDCDKRVVRHLGDPNAYGELLLTVAQAASRGPRLQPALLGGSGSLERRLRELLAPAPLRNVQRFLLPALALGLLVIAVIAPHPVVQRGAHLHTTAAQAAAPTLSLSQH